MIIVDREKDCATNTETGHSVQFVKEGFRNEILPRYAFHSEAWSFEFGIKSDRGLDEFKRLHPEPQWITQEERIQRSGELMRQNDARKIRNYHIVEGQEYDELIDRALIEEMLRLVRQRKFEAYKTIADNFSVTFVESSKTIDAFRYRHHIDFDGIFTSVDEMKSLS
ncbi:MAG: hypothetical protein AAFQ47_08880 [Pseudomonadota bacterium]